MNRRTKAFLVPFLAAFLAPDGSAQPPASASRMSVVPRPAIPARLADVSWISGRWLSDEKGTLSEESWGPPAGDSIVGTWRLAVNGSVKVVELLTMVEEEGRVVLRLRHFDRRGVAREEKDRPLVLPLVARGTRVAVFEGQGPDGVIRLTYRREGRSLTVALEKTGEAAQSYQFRRAAAP